ncbi:MAG: hypothetical protein HY985_13530, partial [Magnetospirillum sp.]|nr:hypothetical protein [Magnetospirillum sp.]
MRDVALLLGCLAMLPLALRFPHIGVMLWVWTGLLAPGDYLWGFMAAVPLNKIVAAVTVVALLVAKDRRPLYADATLLLIAALLPLGLLSATQSISASPEVWVIFEKTLKVAVLCVAVTLAMTTRLRLYSLLLAIVLGLGLTAAVGGLAFIATGGAHRLRG